jgi:parallel beta-helix repeat protein
MINVNTPKNIETKMASGAMGRGIPTCYVDQTSGNDSNPGTSPAQAWKTIAQVNGFSFSRPVRVLLKRGATWAEKMTVPVNVHYVGNYGSGALPIVTGSGSRDSCFYINGKNNVVFDGLATTANVWYAFDVNNANGVTVKNCSCLDVGRVGILFDTCTNVNIFNNIVNGANTNGISANASNGVSVSYNDVSRCGLTTDDRSGISIWGGCDNVAVHHNVSHDHTNSGGTGIRGIIIDTNPAATNIRVYQNLCHHCDGSGIYVWNSTGTIVYYNICHTNLTVSGGATPSGIYVAQGSNGTQLYNNVVSNNSMCSIRLRNSSACIAKNNIALTQSLQYSISTEATGATSHTLDYNLVNSTGRAQIYGWNGTDYTSAAAFYAATGQGQHDSNATPLVVSVATPDFHLQAGSPARSAGVGVGLSVDYDGVTVPATPDIGAYQYA